MNVEKKFLIILLIIFLVSITGVSAIEAPGNDTGVDDASISSDVGDVGLDMSSSDENDVSSVADESQTVNDDENLTDVAGASDNDVLGASDGEDVLGAELPGTAGNSLTNLGNYITSHQGNTFVLDHDYTTGGTANGYLLNDNSNIICKNGKITINSGANRAFAVGNGAHVTFKNIIFRGHHHDAAESRYGGVIHIGSNAVVTFENCEFQECYYTATTNGGGAVFAGRNSKVTLTSCIFNGCYSRFYGGALFCADNSDVNMTGCNFIKCHVSYDTSDEKRGGAIYFGSGNDIAMANCDFVDNYVSNTNAAGAKGGSIYIAGAPSNANIKGSLFSGSSATTMGGAIYIDDANMAANHNITFDTCTFVNNVVSANSAVIREGGAISANSVNNLYVINSNFENNRVENNYNNANAAASGGAISVRDGCKNLNIIGTTFASNKALNSYVSSNVKNGAGAAIHFIGNIEDSMIKGCTFTSNTASRDGGAIMFGTMNNAQNTIRNTHVLDSTFTSNQASYGGAIFLNTNVENHNVTGCTFTSNKATANEGGAINYYGSSNKDITIGSAFISNVATTHGPAIAFDLPTATFTNIKFIGASFKGHSTQSGTVYFSKGLSSLLVENTTFESNTVTEEGSSGAFYFPFVSNANFINSKFINNRAPYGGALYIVPGSDSVFHFEDCEFTGNTATVAEASGVTTKGGGAIYFYKYQTGFNIDNLTFLRTSFAANSAKTFGGAVFLLSDDEAIDFYRNCQSHRQIIKIQPHLMS